MKRFPCAGLLLITLAGHAYALVPEVAIADSQTAHYVCAGGKNLKVRYLNAHNGQHFALLSPQGKPLLFVQTLAASGVKYQAEQYVWWSKGNTGNLYDSTQPNQAVPLLANCRSNDLR